MKKYWKLLVVSLVIIFAISAHYMQSVKALQKEQVTFRIDRVAGDESELDNLTLQTSYYNRYTNQWVYLTKDGVRDVRNSYAAGGLFKTYEPLVFERYLEEYRSFMRGKEYDLNRFNEDDARLIYVKTTDIGKTIYKGDPISLKVDILHKETKERTKFDATALAKVHYDWVNISDVYAADGEIKVLVAGSFADGGADLQLYTIAEETQQVTQSETLSIKVKEGDVFANVYYTEDAQSVGNMQYHIFKESTWRYDEQKGVDEELTNDYYMYSLATNTIDALQLPNDAHIYTTFQNDDFFYAVAHHNETLTVYSYDLANKVWKKPFATQLQMNIEHNMPYVKVNGNKLYIANSVGNVNELSIYNVETTELLYAGEISGEPVGPYAEITVDQIFY